MIVKAFLIGWILVIVSLYACNTALAGFCSASSCNSSSVPVIPDVTLELSPKSMVYLKIGSHRILVAEFPIEIEWFKNIVSTLSASYVDCRRLQEQWSFARDPDLIPVQQRRPRGR
jgi:hypothetical protein